MDAERKTQRERRQERHGFAGTALVGYTNASKSTLMRALTGSEVLVARSAAGTVGTVPRRGAAVRLFQRYDTTAGRGSACIALFVLAWIGQFIGHHYEGKRPSFFKDIQFLMIGPLWLLSFIYRKLRIPY